MQIKKQFIQTSAHRIHAVLSLLSTDSGARIYSIHWNKMLIRICFAFPVSGQGNFLPTVNFPHLVASSSYQTLPLQIKYIYVWALYLNLLETKSK